ncbi:MAG: LysM peptidoglycan-binding domain-containing protein [Ignavibacteriae bacterium]|nr:LysM peptidoglycan-binding domain-containing protein [Ignavibacteriota bacterium]MCB9214303.1 LysM peptidoglycan-binding domain-containing protein [Ignavibacteria bacterium]
MSLHEKYNPVLELGKELNVKNGNVEEADGKLKITGTVPVQGHKDLLWDKIKAIGGENPVDIEADIQVDSTGAQFHEVQPGETLSKIAAQYLGNANRYPEIFKANTYQLSDPDRIQIGQRIFIPE